MAEDNNTSLAPEVTETKIPETKPALKKTRAPRQKKTAAADVVADDVVSAPLAAEPAKSSRGRKATAAVEKPEIAAKATRMKRTPKAAAQPQVASSSALDEMQDLTKLEEENKQLRKLLSEKLRGENADLRKRLGQA